MPACQTLDYDLTLLHGAPSSSFSPGSRRGARALVPASRSRLLKARLAVNPSRSRGRTPGTATRGSPSPRPALADGGAGVPRGVRLAVRECPSAGSFRCPAEDSRERVHDSSDSHTSATPADSERAETFTPPSTVDRVWRADLPN